MSNFAKNESYCEIKEISSYWLRNSFELKAHCLRVALSLVDPKGEGTHPPRSNFFHFYAVFSKNPANWIQCLSQCTTFMNRLKNILSYHSSWWLQLPSVSNSHRFHKFTNEIFPFKHRVYLMNRLNISTDPIGRTLNPFFLKWITWKCFWVSVYWSRSCKEIYFL